MRMLTVGLEPKWKSGSIALILGPQLYKSATHQRSENKQDYWKDRRTGIHLIRL
jgi:hypothetical protein